MFQINHTEHLYTFSFLLTHLKFYFHRRFDYRNFLLETIQPILFEQIITDKCCQKCLNANGREIYSRQLSDY